MRKFLFVCALCCIPAFAHASGIEIATLSLSSAPSSGGFAGSATMTNLTDVTVNLNGFIINGTKFGGTETLGPNSSGSVFSWSSPSGTELGLFGDLSASTFSIGSTLFTTTSTDWVVTFSSSANGVVDVFITPTPEPSSMLLMLTGLSGSLAMIRRRARK